MAFVNEIVSEPDIREHRLDELKAQYDPWSWRDGRPSTFVHAWTIDRLRKVFLYVAFQWTGTGQSGRSEPIRKYTCIIDFGGQRAIAIIERAPGSSYSYKDSPFRIQWRIVKLDTSGVLGMSQQAIVAVLKEALGTYGDGGVHRQAAHTLVSFDF